MEIKEVSFVEEGAGTLLSKFALVETKKGQKFVYTIAFNQRTWKDIEDYIDNVKSDFKNESDSDDFGEDDMGLFVNIERWR